MTDRWPDAFLERLMLADAALNSNGGCHVLALLARVRELEDRLQRSEEMIRELRQQIRRADSDK